MAVASDARGPGFATLNEQLFTVCRKGEKIEKKRPGWPIFKKK